MDANKRIDLSLSVVIPVHNEAGIIRQFIDDIYQKCLNQLFDYELIIVEDGSTDGTREILLSSRDKHPNLKLSFEDRKLGYGSAAKKGISTATKEWVLLMDGDGQIEPADVNILLSSASDYDIVLAEKFPRCDPMFRIILSRGFDVLTDMILGVSIRDINFGFRLMRNSVAQKIVPACGCLGDIFNAEVAIRFIYGGYRLTQMKVRHRKRLLGGSQGVPGYKVISTSWRAYMGLFSLKKELTKQ